MLTVIIWNYILRYILVLSINTDFNKILWEYPWILNLIIGGSHPQQQFILMLMMKSLYLIQTKKEDLYVRRKLACHLFAYVHLLISQVKYKCRSMLSLVRLETMDTHEILPRNNHWSCYCKSNIYPVLRIWAYV